MAKRLYTKTKIFFPDPYVIRLEHPEHDSTIMSSSYRDALKIARTLIFGTWGYCTPESEFITTRSPEEFNALPQAQRLSVLFDGAGEIKIRSYWCFADEMDALQFRLSIGVSATKVDIWPSRLFTIQEIIKDDPA